MPKGSSFRFTFAVLGSRSAGRRLRSLPASDGVVNDLAEYANQFVGLGDERVETRVQKITPTANPQSKAGFLGFLQGDTILCYEVVVAGCAVGFLGI